MSKYTNILLSSFKKIAIHTVFFPSMSTTRTFCIKHKLCAELFKRVGWKPKAACTRGSIRADHLQLWFSEIWVMNEPHSPLRLTVVLHVCLCVCWGGDTVSYTKVWYWDVNAADKKGGKQNAKGDFCFHNFWSVFLWWNSYLWELFFLRKCEGIGSIVHFVRYLCCMGNLHECENSTVVPQNSFLVITCFGFTMSPCFGLTGNKRPSQQLCQRHFWGKICSFNKFVQRKMFFVYWNTPTLRRTFCMFVHNTCCINWLHSFCRHLSFEFAFHKIIYLGDTLNNINFWSANLSILIIEFCNILFPVCSSLWKSPLQQWF